MINSAHVSESERNLFDDASARECRSEIAERHSPHPAVSGRDTIHSSRRDSAAGRCRQRITPSSRVPALAGSSGYLRTRRPSTATLWIPFAATIVGSLVALFGVLYVSQRTVRTALEINERMLALQNKLKYSEIVIDALRFFGSNQGTQSRGVGIAVIRANIDNPDFAFYRLTWRAVLEMQALFLLTGSKELDRPEEIANLGAIVDLLGTLKQDKPALNNLPIKAAQALNAVRGPKDPGLDLTGNGGRAVVAAIQAL